MRRPSTITPCASERATTSSCSRRSRAQWSTTSQNLKVPTGWSRFIGRARGLIPHRGFRLDARRPNPGRLLFPIFCSESAVPTMRRGCEPLRLRWVALSHGVLVSAWRIRWASCVVRDAVIIACAISRTRPRPRLDGCRRRTSPMAGDAVAQGARRGNSRPFCCRTAS